MILFKVIGVLAKQGSFLGMFSFDNQVIIPIDAFRKFFSVRWGLELRVKVKDKTKVDLAKEELQGHMRRVSCHPHGMEDNVPATTTGHAGAQSPRKGVSCG